jgi:hypothetical protein
VGSFIVLRGRLSGGRLDLGGDRNNEVEASLDAGEDAGEHLRGGLAVDPPDGAAVLGAPPAGVAHELVDHAGGDAVFLQPGGERVAQVMRAAQLQVVQ